MKAWIVSLVLLAAWPEQRAFADQPKLTASLAVTREPDAESCIDSKALGKAVEERLGRPVFDLGPRPDLGVELTLRKQDRAGFRADLVLRDRDGHELGRRELVTDAAHCSALDASLALVIALFVDAPPTPEAPAPQEPQTPTAEEPLPRRPPKGTPIRLPEGTFAPREPWQFEPALSFALAFGLLPGVAPGASFAFGFRPPRFVYFALSGTWFPAEVEGGEQGVEVSLARIGALLCPLSESGRRGEIAACLEQQVGRVSARAFGFDVNDSASGLMYSLGASAMVRAILVGPLFLRIMASVEVPLTRGAYVGKAADGQRIELFRPAPLALGGQLGLGVEL